MAAKKKKTGTKSKKASAKKSPVKKATAKKAVSRKATAVKKRTPGPRIQNKNRDKIGIFGGYFNPIHVGHMQSMMEVMQQLDLKKVLVIPSNIPPHKEQSGLDIKDRVEMVKRALGPYQEQLVLDLREITRGGTSYTVDTLKELNKEYDPSQLYLIMGPDAFLSLDTWRDPAELVKKTNLVVTTRFGNNVVFEPENFPNVVRQHLALFIRGKATLTTGTTIEQVEIESVDASATNIRKRIRDDKGVEDLVQPQVLKYIREKELYKRKSPLVDDYREFAKFCATRAADKKAHHVKAYDLSKLAAFTEYTVICSGTSTRHASAVAESIVVSVKECFGLHPLSVEGAREGRWILIDYGALVVHVFYDVVREEYQIEKLWKGAQEISLELTPAAAGKFESTHA